MSAEFDKEAKQESEATAPALSESDLARQKAVFELRKLQRENTLIGRLLATAPGLVSLAVSFVSILIASSTFSLQSQRAKEDFDAAQAK
jgi:hypothetical protein